MVGQGAGGQVGHRGPGHHPCEFAAYAFGFTAHLSGDVATLVDEAAEDGSLLKHGGTLLSFSFRPTVRGRWGGLLLRVRPVTGHARCTLRPGTDIDVAGQVLMAVARARIDVLLGRRATVLPDCRDLLSWLRPGGTWI
jgi:hypothetical protein